MKVLIACEESQRVCIAFRKRGHEAYSCDIQEPSGGHPEWHILGDALEAIKGGVITSADGKTHDVGRWDLLIAHPPCTYLSNVATRSFSLRCTPPEKVVSRWEERARGAVFFMQFLLANAERIAISGRISEYGIPKTRPDHSPVHVCLIAEGYGELCNKGDMPMADKSPEAMRKRASETE